MSRNASIIHIAIMTGSWLHFAGSAIQDAHRVMLPSTVEKSGFFAPLNCFGQQDAVNNAVVELERAARKATIAADQTFLVKPINIPMPQALSSSRLLVVHNDAAAKAAAHLSLAVKNLKPYQTVGADGLAVASSMIDSSFLFLGSLIDRNRFYSDFIFC